MTPTLLINVSHWLSLSMMPPQYSLGRLHEPGKMSVKYVDASLISKQALFQNKTRKYVRLLDGDAISEPTMYTHPRSS